MNTNLDRINSSSLMGNHILHLLGMKLTWFDCEGEFYGIIELVYLCFFKMPVHLVSVIHFLYYAYKITIVEFLRT